jgi:hypothetical protein
MKAVGLKNAREVAGKAKVKLPLRSHDDFPSTPGVIQTEMSWHSDCRIVGFHSSS